MFAPLCLSPHDFRHCGLLHQIPADGLRPALYGGFMLKRIIGNSAFLSAFVIIFFSSVASAQTVPCADARSEAAKFVNPSRKSIERECGRQIRRLPQRTEGEQPDVSISGHITHQNGVRMSGVTVSLHHVATGTTRSVVTDEMGNYFIGAIPWGSEVELTPSLVNYQFYPP